MGSKQTSIDQSSWMYVNLVISYLQIVTSTSTTVVEVPSSLPSTRLTAAEQPSQLIETLNSCIGIWMGMIK